MNLNKSQKKLIKNAGEVAFLALEAVAAGAAACPPLQSVAGFAVHITTLSRNFKSDKKRWTEFGDYVHDLVEGLVHCLTGVDLERKEIKEKIDKLALTLQEIEKDIQNFQSKGAPTRFLKFAKNPQRITEMKQRLDESIKVFQTGMILTAGMDVATLVDAQKQVQHVVQLLTRLQPNNSSQNALVPMIMERCLELIESTIDFSSLPFTKDAGWNDALVCLPGTRKSAIDHVLKWVNDPELNGSEQIYLVADVVGSGKTALAHSVAEQCFEERVLVSSFFFDRKAGRTRPRDFLTTLAHDIGSRNQGTRRRISLALAANPSLAISQSLSRLFERLILDPVLSSDIHLDGPLVVVVDALNEGDNEELYAILRNEVPKLPRNFRFFLTSRPERVLHALGPAIHPRELGIHHDENRKDIAVYVAHRLAQIAERYQLENWPSAALTGVFLERAEGLFLWASAICEYLLNHVCYPDKMLDTFLSGTSDSLLPPEQRMDSVYMAILHECPWDDVYFADGYQQVMGAIVALQIPLCIQAIQHFHDPSVRVKNVLSPLTSLITGAATIDQPVRILHSSFRDCITIRDTLERRVRVNSHMGRLGILCLHLLNNIFTAGLDGLGYLCKAVTDLGIPVVMTDQLSEAEWYAIRFWPSHVVELGRLEGEALDALCTFLSRHIVAWIEVLVSKWPYRSIMPVALWLKTTFHSNKDRDLHRLVVNSTIWRTLSHLPIRLICDSRQSESLEVIKDLLDMKKAVSHLPSPPTKFTKVPRTSLPRRSTKLGQVSDSDSDMSMPNLQSVSESDSEEYSGVEDSDVVEDSVEYSDGMEYSDGVKYSDDFASRFSRWFGDEEGR